jgi:hypothetical protein
MGLWNKRSLKNLQKVFPLTGCIVQIEPLYDWDRESYFKNHLEHLRSKSPLLGKLADRIFRPYHKPLMKVIARFVEGRNLLAIYTKLPDNDGRHSSRDKIRPDFSG